MTDTTTETPTYVVAPDGYDKPTLWRSDRDERGEELPLAAVATKHELDRLDPILWPTLVAALVRPPVDVEKWQKAADEVVEFCRDNANYWRGHGFPAATEVDHDLATSFELISGLVDAGMGDDR